MAGLNAQAAYNGNREDAHAHGHDRDSLFRRSWHVMADLVSPFSAPALASLPKNPLSSLRASRSKRTDRIPDEQEGQSTVVEAGPSVIRDYNAINSVPPKIQVRVPKKVSTPVQVEGKVWFANERTWIAYLNIGVLIGTLALALFNASKDQIARNFAYAYAMISVFIIYGYVVYQKRITMIRRRDPGHFDQILGPVVIAVLIFIAVLANFLIRVNEVKRHRKGIDSP